VPQRLICVLAILVVASGTSPVRTQTKPSADAAKGTFVYNVLNFVEWPPSSLKANGGIHVAVISADPLPDFAAALNGRSVRGRSIVVKAYRTAGQLEPSEVVYIAADAISEVRAVLRAVNQQAVLTIAEQSLDTQGLTVLSLGACILQSPAAVIGVVLDVAILAALAFTRLNAMRVDATLRTTTR